MAGIALLARSGLGSLRPMPAALSSLVFAVSASVFALTPIVPQDTPGGAPAITNTLELFAGTVSPGRLLSAGSRKRFSGYAVNADYVRLKYRTEHGKRKVRRIPIDQSTNIYRVRVRVPATKVRYQLRAVRIADGARSRPVYHSLVAAVFSSGNIVSLPPSIFGPNATTITSGWTTVNDAGAWDVGSVTVINGSGAEHVLVTEVTFSGHLPTGEVIDGFYVLQSTGEVLDLTDRAGETVYVADNPNLVYGTVFTPYRVEPDGSLTPVTTSSNGD